MPHFSLHPYRVFYKAEGAERRGYTQAGSAPCSGATALDDSRSRSYYTIKHGRRICDCKIWCELSYV